MKKDHPVFLSRSKKASGLCFECHDTFQKKIQGAKHTHGAISEKGCMGCHDPHIGAHPALLRKPMHKALCLECHKKETAGMKRHHAGALGEKQQCLHCHRVHTADTDNLLSGGEKSLCLSCHGKEIRTESGKTVSSIGNELDHSAFHHGPIAKGKCSGCHVAHGTEHGKLLVDKHEESGLFRGIQHVALCFTCHKRELLTESRTGSSTRFRNGKTNLHAIHVTLKDKGRNCNVCHSVHGGTNKQLVRDIVELYGNKTQLLFRPSANGGTCTTMCHLPATYNRLRAVKNRLKK
jgi:predicted CXXCH cytochrome family protein